MYEIYLRDTPQNEASQASQGEINNDCALLTGTEANLGTCLKASQGEEKHDLGRNGTGPINLTGPMEQVENTEKTDVGRLGRENLEGIPEKKSTPNGDDDELLGEVVL